MRMFFSKVTFNYKAIVSIWLMLLFHAKLAEVLTIHRKRITRSLWKGITAIAFNVESSPQTVCQIKCLHSPRFYRIIHKISIRKIQAQCIWRMSSLFPLWCDLFSFVRIPLYVIFLTWCIINEDNHATNLVPKKPPWGSYQIRKMT